MAFSSIVRALARSPLTAELTLKLNKQQELRLNGISRLPKTLIASALANSEGKDLCVVCATLEEAGRVYAQMEAMGWKAVHFYPTSEASPYEPFDPETELSWGQMQVLADLVAKGGVSPEGKLPQKNTAIIVTVGALQPHLPPPDAFKSFCVTLKKGMEFDLDAFSEKITILGYERVPLVETEGQWSRRGDIVDIFPVSSELPVRLEWFGDEIEQIREFDPTTQRSALDKINEITLTPTSFTPIILDALKDHPHFPENVETLHATSLQGSDLGLLEGSRRFLGLAFAKPASLLDYLAENALVAIDEPEQCYAHSDRWVENAQEQWEEVGGRGESYQLPKIHRSLDDCLVEIGKFKKLYLSELAEENTGLNLASRPLPVTPHQFAKLAETIRQERDRKFAVWVLSAQPSRSVSLLQEHDCPAQFIPNPRDYQAIDKLQINHTPIALKYSGLAELEGCILPSFRLVIVTDREFYGQHSLANFGYIRKRRKAASKQVDPNKLRPGDYVVHRSHGIGKFVKLESLTINHETRDYLVVQYADGLLRVAADQVGSLSRFRTNGDKAPQLHKMTGKAWENTKNKVRKAIKKLAVDLLKLYAARSQQEGFSYPADMPWQEEMEDSFPYQPTTDQLKAVQDVKRDMESERPMDRLVCGDVGFGKTEVAIRAIFKAVTAGKQVALLAPTTILTQQHYHTIKERFAPYPVNVGLLNRFRSAEEKRNIQKRLATGELDIVVGTHQLLGKGVQFRDLGLLVIDEEQRFGVNQKEKIKSLKTQVDVLTLSATPIPRTLYMSLSGIREMSLITTPPPTRRPIQTHLAPLKPEIVRSAIRQELDRGGQVFYVVPRVEGIEETTANLREMIPGGRFAIAHGQMDESELESTMLTFGNNDADILVCTTIIESGLDIPRVNTILIEDAHRFGLAQLYQLRGRVGRAGIQAHAWLFYPKQRELSDAARQRLRAIQEFTQLGSGYQLAMRDMEIRGVGNLLGAEQSGQLDAIGFDLYMEMLEEAIREIRGQEIPKVDDTQIDLNLTAFIPSTYITDIDQKMSAYRAVATAKSKEELTLIAAEWTDRYGTIPVSANQLLRVMELKQIAKNLGFSRIKPENKQHIVLETPMEEPAWNLLAENLKESMRSRFIYSPGKVTARGLGVFKAEQQLQTLIDTLSKMQGAIPEAALV
ncbi:transcription-repair coupling factor [Anabaena cylindrica FACHB-243]|uniref:Transcription-repair-coupling factor n=1 Tax=Anabaena cylindrica (strain ATCC 27899 / PCC 7122) TaxID=272123 RepID=K9ZNN6_ANACC|nr:MULTISPECIES: transcription-repair coupling factor [Anabaena]AFZ59940.1 transcription-repair coupling factor [Anabaena cylindrica PCC 7122]MBD2419032.1 transcription-repair coupling factor [Anabaena cylindrica FACHB-243]MBY5282686.1 transcription-repair coupling factor [Anabaena sp. CCAP 1446/1C]MBY5307562.1 transcription-repair coupling factor [Anabaena sp. CCAP 1446/1C]MCM2407842.1 transcription-repair coupling factor [Anabaena sp. CCAP 1446/1C]